VRRFRSAARAQRAWYRPNVATKKPDRVGQLIGQRYELQAIIGRGGQGMVYRAFDRWMGRAVAVKTLDSKAAREPKMVERLMREQQAMTVLKGTAAVEVFDMCQGNDGELCLVMELLTGLDLDEHLYALSQRKERMPLPRVAEIFDPIVSTLQTAHSAGILHRDLKPANIFLLDGGSVRLLDFGMARLKNAAPLTAAGTVMGSPSFMAPEAWNGLSDLMDQRADVYSLGVILFLVLAGDLPFEGNTLQEKFRSVTSGQRASLLAARPDLPRGADDWVALALARDREQRFVNVQALWSAFLSVFHVTPPSRKRESWWAAAKGAVQKIAGRSEPAPPRLGALPDPQESQLAREALARSVFRPPEADTLPPAEATMELTDADFKRVAPPPRKPPPPRPEKTVSMSDADLSFEPSPGPPAPRAPDFGSESTKSGKR
jgi:eukaryotic-like serine/threonine-protein kinase